MNVIKKKKSKYTGWGIERTNTRAKIKEFTMGQGLNNFINKKNIDNIEFKPTY